LKIIFKIIKFYCKPTYKKYLKSLLNHEKEQRLTLDKITNNLIDPKTYRSISEFRSSHKIKGHDELGSSPTLLNSHKIIFHEETSGSSGDKKKIPYTKELISSFTTMFTVWIYDLLTNGPTLRSGKLYFSVSPQFKTDNDTKINDDSDYLSGPLKYIVNYFSIVPKEIKHVTDPQAFLNILSHYFIRSEQLEIISIWSPSYLIQVLDHLSDNKEKFLSSLDLREIKHNGIVFRLPKLSQTYKQQLISTHLSVQSLFPNLKIVSCWGSQHAKAYLVRIKELCPQALIQTKGLLATEAPLTVPVIASKSHCPLPSEVFYEFIDIDDEQKEIKLLHELKLNKKYEIVITQKSGLIRYPMKDLIQVDGFYQTCPTFQFIGRAQDLSDLVGEKIDANFLNRIFSEHFPSSSLSLIPTSLPNQRANYTLMSNVHVNINEVEKFLIKNIHYKNARALRQLGELDLVHHPKMIDMISRYYSEEKLISRGDQKEKSLHKNEYNGYMIKTIKQYISESEAP
jgi:hypothetical protein